MLSAARRISTACAGLAAAAALGGAVQARYAPGVGTWEGTYRCSQGLTGVRLTVRTLGQDPSAREAVFAFHEIGGSADRPQGSYVVRGTMVNGRMTLRPHQWVQRYRSYGMRGLDGVVRGDVYAGEVTGGGCREFSMRRQGAYLLTP